VSFFPPYPAPATKDQHQADWRKLVEWAAQLVAFKGVHAYRDVDTTITDNTITLVTLTAESYDPQNMHAASSSELVIPQPGWWQVRGAGRFAGNATGFRYAEIRVNGTARATNRKLSVSASAATPVEVETAPLRLATGDRLELAVYQNSGGDLNIVQGEHSVFLSAFLVGT
jgi:hypothetical protein